jgi:hypothetical protein
MKGTVGLGQIIIAVISIECIFKVRREALAFLFSRYRIISSFLNTFLAITVTIYNGASFKPERETRKERQIEKHAKGTYE